MHLAIRLAAAGILAVALGIPTGAVAHSKSRGSAPVQRAFFPAAGSRDRGTNVVAIQRLLHAHGIRTAVDGRFDSRLRGAVRQFQRHHGLRARGRVDAATWRSLVVPLGPPSRGPAVRALEGLIAEKVSRGLKVDRRFGFRTRLVLRRLQARMGMQPTGRANTATWRALVWHFERPEFARRSLCDYSTVNGREANWGTSSAIALLEEAARLFHHRTRGRVAIGDISLRFGGDIAGHRTHHRGLDVDIRPIREDRRQCGPSGVDWREGAYDRRATRGLVRAIRDAAGRRVRVILFNDPAFLRDRLTQYMHGHDNHLHVRFCEDAHPLTNFRCWWDG